MSVSVPHLRRWFLAALIFVSVVVMGSYFFLHHRVQNALKQVPGEIGINIQQSAQGFTISKSEQGRTLFKLQAGNAIQFKQGGRVELHDVSITLYGRDSSRFDQVYGSDFEYDPQSGNVTSKGEVSIDLEANPRGMLTPDQAAPKELKNPIHLKTTDLIFDKNTGDAWTNAAVEFSVPQANGSAVGAKYIAKESLLALNSQVKIAVRGSSPTTILAQNAILRKSPRQIDLRDPHVENPDQQGDANKLTLFLRDDNALDRAVAEGDVRMHSTGEQPTAASCQKVEVWMEPKTEIRSAVLSGNVHVKTEGQAPAEASAGRAVLSFAARNALTKIHAEQDVTLLQHTTAHASEPQSGSQNGQGQHIQATAPAMNFFVAASRHLDRVETIGAPQITLLSADAKQPLKTEITADKFTAKFDSNGQLASVHGQRDARVVTSGASQAGVSQTDRISTSDSIDAFFRPGTGVESLVQEGHFTYTAGPQQAFAALARYRIADQFLSLTGSPRITDSGMATTATSIRLNRATGDGLAQGDVKTTYNDLKPQPSGALLASSAPVHVTAQNMTAHNSPATATYSGGARLWQNGNMIEAPSITFQKDQRTVIADSNSNQKVSTVLIGTDKSGKAAPVRATSSHLIYKDSERKAHFDGGVTAASADLTIASKQMDVFLAPSRETLGGRAFSPVQDADKQTSQSVMTPPMGETPVHAQSQSGSPAKVEKIIASGSVVITEPNRHATGEQLTYTAAEDKFVLTGGPPSIFDAEHGKITGVSLTLFRRDDRFVVQGDSSSPAVTQTRVVR